MGICHTDHNREQSQKSRIIDAELRKQGLGWNKENKILLLGPGESGKSTVFKQMKIIQDGGGFSIEERQAFTHVVHSNCISQMRVLAQAAIKSNVSLSSENMKMADLLQALPHAGNTWTAEIGNAIKSLWSDAGIQSLYHSAGKNIQLNDTADYFFNNIDNFIKPDYIPTVDDVLRVRVRSTGIEEAEFKFDKMIFKVVDVGGQRSERRKWIHCFDCVTSVLFCASLSGYNQTLREEGSVNRMEEALNLFEDVVNSTCFARANIILFLNKTDLFKEKIKRVDLSEYFENYTGGADFEKACEFIAMMFRERVANGRRKVYIHFTCAIDTENIERMIYNVRAKVISELLVEISTQI